VRELENEVARLRDKLAKADLIIDVKKTFHPAGTEHRQHTERAEVISAAANLAGELDVAAACRAQLLDEGRYLASVRTMYRLLQSCSAVRERRNQLRHPEYAKPELLAVTPNQVLSGDITKLKGPVRGKCSNGSIRCLGCWPG
jgi:hypothetical protein